MNKKIPVTLCCSGGVDSTALIHYYLQRHQSIQCVHFDYGHPACEGERTALIAISQRYRVSIEYARLRPAIGNMSISTGEIYGRNALFVLSALNQVKQTEGLISLGIHAGTGYYDCTPTFAQQMQAILDGYFQGAVVLDTPFLYFSKGDIFAYCQQNSVPVELTYSCERNAMSPCGSCPSCLDRKQYDSRY